MNDRENQNKDVLNYIIEKGSISFVEAFWELGIARLSARIFDLRRQGYDIKTTMIPFVSKRGRKSFYALYTLVV